MKHLAIITIALISILLIGFLFTTPTKKNRIRATKEGAYKALVQYCQEHNIDAKQFKEPPLMARTCCEDESYYWVMYCSNNYRFLYEVEQGGSMQNIDKGHPCEFNGYSPTIYGKPFTTLEEGLKQ